MTTPTPIAEITRRALVSGVLFGLIFGAANAYLGLRVGMTVSTSIPVAVMTVALFRVFGGQASILEANLAQTIGSASTALATGSIFTLPALWLWGAAPPYLQVVAIALLGGVLGISAMIPLRELLIVRAARELPYPEGTACAEVLRATTTGARGVGGAIFIGLLLGALIKLGVELAGVIPRELSVAVPELPNGLLAIEIAPALFGVGYILGARGAGVLVSGSLVSALALIPIITVTGGLHASATEVWAKHVRYVGAGAVALAGMVTVVRGLGEMARSFGAVWRGIGAAQSGERTARDLPGWLVGGGVALVVTVVALIPGVLGGGLGLLQRVVCAVAIGVLGICFVAVAARIVGLVGVSSQPTSGIALVTLLMVGGLFAAAGWTHSGARAAVLAVGAIVCIAASKAGDISQDLKTGQLVGATPARQQLGQYLGAATACFAVAATLAFLGRAYGFGSRDLPAPQATLMKTIIEGVLEGTLPWPLVLSGGGLSLAAMLAGVNGLGFAIGLYLPLGAMTPLFAGGLVRALAERGRTRASHDGADGGVLMASGLVAGEGLAGVVIAACAAAWNFRATPPSGVVAGLAALLAVGATAGALLAAGRARS